jgi:hypothetical protein
VHARLGHRHQRRAPPGVRSSTCPVVWLPLLRCQGRGYWGREAMRLGAFERRMLGGHGGGGAAKYLPKMRSLSAAFFLMTSLPILDSTSAKACDCAFSCKQALTGAVRRRGHLDDSPGRGGAVCVVRNEHLCTGMNIIRAA